MIIKEADRLNSVTEYYFAKKLKFIEKLKEESGKEIVNLGIGNPDLPPSEDYIQALKHSASDPKNHGYQSYRGIKDLRLAMSRWYKKIFNVDVDAESEVLPLSGSKEGIFHLTMAFVNTGDKVLVPDPGYLAYSQVNKIVGGEVIYYDLKESNRWNIDLGQIRSMDLKNVKLMWLNSPHMPTGSHLSEEVFKELVMLAKENNFLICHDNPYGLISNQDPVSIFNFEGASEVAVEINSLSKSHNMAGWRIGWLAGKQEYLNAVFKVKSNIDSGMFLPIQHAAISALKTDVEWHRQQQEIYDRRREIVYRLLDKLGCSYSKNQSGLFVWAKLGEHTKKKSEEFVDDLILHQGVFVAPGNIFGENGEGFIRVSLCQPDEDIELALDRIC
jgi:LL-diaminopimelate aminotransferase